MAGFHWSGSLDGSEPIIQEFVVKASAVISKGEFCNLETGEADAGAAADTALIGIATESVDNTVDGHTVHVIVNPNAIYATDDANARVTGALLDLASGGMGLAADSSHTFMVVSDSAADEPTQVTFNGTHFTQV